MIDYVNDFHHSNPSPLSESQVVDLVSDVNWARSSFAKAQTWSVLIYTHVDVEVAGKFNGSGSTGGLRSESAVLLGRCSMTLKIHCYPLKMISTWLLFLLDLAVLVSCL